MSSSTHDVVVVGGGLAGVRRALDAAAAGLSPLVLEAAPTVGGRMRTERVDGFRIDRGFQVLLTAYPEARAVLDYDALDLKPFDPGAVVRVGGRFARVGDPLRRPSDLFSTLRAPVGTLRDKLRLLSLRRRVLRQEDRVAAAETTDAYLRNEGFSEAMIERFLRPWFGGVFLDRGLSASASLFRFYLAMFARGDTAVPAEGIGAVPRQLADRLPEGAVRTGSPVATVRPGLVRLETGEEVRARAVVVATEATAAARLLDTPRPVPGPSVASFWFSAPEPPLRGPRLVLDGEGRGPVNDLAVLSEVAPSYAPPGRALIVANVPGAGANRAGLAGAVHDQLAEWFGDAVAQWRLLKAFTIREALPRQRPEDLASRAGPRIASGLYLAGDHCASGSLQGALASGRRAAEAVREDLAA